MEKLAKILVQNGHEDDILHRKVFDVHMGFLLENRAYRDLIYTVVEYMKTLMQEPKFEDYGPLRGISGANIGVPFNIIGFRQNGNTVIMLNPKIISKSKGTKVVSSNCGSVLLDKPIRVRRHLHVTVSYYTTSGSFVSSEKFSGAEAFTIQHEINHNNGTLILDEEISE
jgi:peptide deformylase